MADIYCPLIMVVAVAAVMITAALFDIIILLIIRSYMQEFARSWIMRVFRFSKSNYEVMQIEINESQSE